MPRISIIVPVYNVELYLKRCVDSILGQTYKDFELILVNDGSPDNCGNICNELALKDSRVKVIHKKNGGLSSARNAGLDMAVGEYVGFVDSDDWITNDMYEHLIGLVDEYDCEIASASYVFSNGESVFNQSKIKINKYTRKEALYFYLFEGMSKRIADYPVWIKLYRRELFNDIKFPLDQLYEDVATNFSLIQKSSTYVKSNKVCYFYFQDSASITRGGFSERDFDVIKVGKQLVNLALEENDNDILQLAQMKSARSYFSLLTKIAVYGFVNSSNDEKKIIITLTKELRKHYWILMKSPMPINRKIILNLLIIHINCIKAPIKIIKTLTYRRKQI